MADHDEQRQGDRREKRHPMSEEAAVKAFDFLDEMAAPAAAAKARVGQLEAWIKVVRAQQILKSSAKSVAAATIQAEASEEYQQAILAHAKAVEEYEVFYWKRIRAQATIDAWKSKNANDRGLGRLT